MHDWLNHNHTTVGSIWVDTPLMIVFACLCVFGLLMVTSASLEFADREYSNSLHFVNRQMIYIAVATLCAVGIYLFLPSDFWFKYCNKLFILMVASLILVLFVGTEVNGSRRWLLLGPLSVQPSEAAKLATILFVANYIARRGDELRETFKGLVKPIGIVLLLAVLLLLEPDYGTVVIIFSITTSMLFLAGTKLKHMMMYLFSGVGALSLLVWVEPYRWSRVKVFLDPWSKPAEEGYQLVQSLIAIGRGSWLGQGLGDGIQKQFYLPEAHTDFIFSVIAEELGFIGVCLVVVCYLVIIWRCFAIARSAEQQDMLANAYVAYGIGTWFGMQAFVNIAVAMGLLPTKGITLPLISVGGSSLLTFFIAFALLQRIHYESCASNQVLMRHYQYKKYDAAL